MHHLFLRDLTSAHLLNSNSMDMLVFILFCNVLCVSIFRTAPRGLIKLLCKLMKSLLGLLCCVTTSYAAPRGLNVLINSFIMTIDVEELGTSDGSI